MKIVAVGPQLVHAAGQTMMKLIFAFCNFVNALKI
jgi:hypothetical protein